MVDKYYDLPGNPVYHEKIRQLKRRDPADAATIFNPLIQEILDNIQFVRLLAEALAVSSAEELDRLRAEYSSEDSKLRADHTAIRKESSDARTALKTAIEAAIAALRKESSDEDAAIRRDYAAAITAAIAAIPTPDVSGQIGTHDGSAAAHQAIQTAFNNALANHQNNKNNPHALTLDQLGAAAAGHSHTPGSIGAAASGHTHNGQVHMPVCIEMIPAAGAGHGGYIDFHFNGDANTDYTSRIIEEVLGRLRIDGDLTIRGKSLRLQSGNYGSAINLGDGDYVHISEPTDDCLEIKAKKVNIVVSYKDYFTVNGEKVGGGQEITLMSYVPSSLSTGQIALVYV